jgi:hypothetical protein
MKRSVIKKKILLIPIIIVLILSFAMPAFASSYDVHDPRASSTASGIIVTITRPQGDESTFDSNYVICGITSKKRVKVMLLRYDRDQEQYIDFPNLDGNSTWKIGTSGIFMKEIRLPLEGANKIRIVCYQSDSDAERQVDDFTITVLKEDLKDIIKKGFKNFIQMMKFRFG